jgi:hypothetical protein
MPKTLNRRDYGKGTLYWGGELSHISENELYPSYQSTVGLLKQMNIPADFLAVNNAIRFGHRRTPDKDLYFIANRSPETQQTTCTFRASGGPEIWSGVDGSARKLTQYKTVDGLTKIELEFVPYESYFVVFDRNTAVKNKVEQGPANFPAYTPLRVVEGPWDVSFDPKWDGPEHIIFDDLTDWTKHDFNGIKYYSGIASYKKTFDIEDLDDKKYYIDLGVVNDIARVTLNGKDVGVA